MKPLIYIALIAIFLPSCGSLLPSLLPESSPTRKEMRQSNRAARIMKRAQRRALRLDPDIMQRKTSETEVMVAIPSRAGSGVTAPTFTPPLAHFIGTPMLPAPDRGDAPTLPPPDPIAFSLGEATFDFSDSRMKASLHFPTFAQIDGAPPPRLNYEIFAFDTAATVQVEQEVWQPVEYRPRPRAWWEIALMAIGAISILYLLIRIPIKTLP